MRLWAISVFGILIPGILAASELLGLPRLSVPADNLQTADKIELGRLLFHDKRFSADSSISCASCHQADKAFTDGLERAKGINQQIGMRNTPTVVNAAFFESFFLDGRQDSLEGQALGPFVNQIEHGLADHQKIVDVVRHDSNYQKRFKDVFNISLSEISIDHIVKAIASFERTLISGNSPFDRYFFGRDNDVLSAGAARGLRIFRRKGNCANCHEISWNSALFTDNRFYNIGVGFKRLKPVLDNFLDVLPTGGVADQYGLSEEQRSELGRFNVTGLVDDIVKFKTPILRNISMTGPYMHDGSLVSLEEVVEYYGKGGEKNKFLDPAIFPLKLTEQEKKDLVEFMKSLTSPQYQKSK